MYFLDTQGASPLPGAAEIRALRGNPAGWPLYPELCVAPRATGTQGPECSHYDCQIIEMLTKSTVFTHLLWKLPGIRGIRRLYGRTICSVPM